MVKRFETDIVVIGSGFAGISAAVSAAENGARVVLLEKASHTGGVSKMARGIFAVESRLQRQVGIGLTREEAFRIHMDWTHWNVDARLVKAYIDKSASTIDWLEKFGVNIHQVDCHVPGLHYTCHLIGSSDFHRSEDRNEGVTATNVLTDAAVGLGVRILLKTPAVRIIKEGGRIVGVLAIGKSGEEIHVDTKAVIIATGGFSDNPEWIKKYTGYEWGHDLFSFRLPGLTGDGIQMAWEIGAASIEMTMIIHGEGGPLLRHGLLSAAHAFSQPNLVVNQLGERFINEEIMISNLVFEAKAIARQKNRCAYVIFDEDTKKCYVEKGLDFISDGGETHITKAEKFDTELQQAMNRRLTEASDRGLKDIVFVANSLDELCTQTGINLNTLRENIEEYNRYCETGHDELFHKNPKYLRPIKRPKFYARKLILDGWTSTGGIKINYKTEVLTDNYGIIPGLYAAGTDANAIYGDTYVFILPGNLAGFAVNSGRIAGENAAKFVNSIK